MTHRKNTPAPQLRFQITFLLAIIEWQMIVTQASTTVMHGLHFIETDTSL